MSTRSGVKYGKKGGKKLDTDLLGIKSYLSEETKKEDVRRRRYREGKQTAIRLSQEAEHNRIRKFVQSKERDPYKQAHMIKTLPGMVKNRDLVKAHETLMAQSSAATTGSVDENYLEKSKAIMGKFSYHPSRKTNSSDLAISPAWGTNIPLTGSRVAVGLKHRSLGGYITPIEKNMMRYSNPRYALHQKRKVTGKS